MQNENPNTFNIPENNPSEPVANTPELNVQESNENHNINQIADQFFTPNNHATQYLPRPEMVEVNASQNIINTPAGKDAGKPLAIISLVFAFVFMNVLGVMLAIISKNKSSKSGHNSKLAKIALLLNIALIIPGILIAILAFQALVHSSPSTKIPNEFIVTVKEGDAEKAANMIQLQDGVPRDGMIRYSKFLKSALGDKQKLILKYKKNNTYSYIYSIENGNRKYLYINTDSGKITLVDTTDDLNDFDRYK